MRPAAILILSLLLGSPVSAQEDDRSLYWSELTVRAHLDAEGRLHVRERHGMVFDGEWNGGQRRFDLRQGQQLVLDGITRIDPSSGQRFALVQAEPEEVDQYHWDEETLRWRSRLESDPPFDDREIVYELRYVLWPVVLPAGEAGYRLAHDFAFSDREGDIQRFRLDLTLDSAWTSPFGFHIRETAANLAPGEGYTVELQLRHAGAGAPTSGPPPAPRWARAGVAATALAIPLLVVFSLWRRGRELDRIAPLTDPEEIDAGWLEQHIFAFPPEIVGTAWDRSVGEAEVAALLARLVAEGKLSSRIESDEGDEPVLHLQRKAPLSAFAPHERDLIEGLFFDEKEETSTAAVRRHYKDKGFDPAGMIRKALESGLETLPGEGNVSRRWAAATCLLLLGVVLTLFLPGRTGRAPVVVVSLCTSVIAGGLSLSFANLLARRVSRRTGLTIAIALALLLPSVLLALLASGVFHGANAPIFYRPGAELLIGLLIVLAGLGMLTASLARSTETVERLGFRRRLVSARRYFEVELGRSEPRLRDSWFPYLLAFGLGGHVERWFEAFGIRGAVSSGAIAATVAASNAGAGRSAGPTSGSWTGGGPQFGGGSFAGGGAGGVWGVAAAGMAAGVAPPSTGGDGGGVAVSGGGGGGGW